MCHALSIITNLRAAGVNRSAQSQTASKRHTSACVVYLLCCRLLSPQTPKRVAAVPTAQMWPRHSTCQSSMSTLMMWRAWYVASFGPLLHLLPVCCFARSVLHTQYCLLPCRTADILPACAAMTLQPVQMPHTLCSYCLLCAYLPPSLQVRVCELAAEWRQTWKTDVVIDLVCYR